MIKFNESNKFNNLKSYISDYTELNLDFLKNPKKEQD